MRKAISYWLMRVTVSGSPIVVGEVLVERGEIVEHRAAVARGDAGGIVEIEHGIRAGAELHALVLEGRKPLPHRREKIGWSGVFPGALGNEDHVGGQVLVRRCRGRS